MSAAALSPRNLSTNVVSSFRIITITNKISAGDLGVLNPFLLKYFLQELTVQFFFWLILICVYFIHFFYFRINCFRTNGIRTSPRES